MINILKSSDCCGCTACASVCTRKAIIMKEDVEGFLYPNVNTDLCNDCGLCEKVCPLIKRRKMNLTPSYLSIYAVRLKDKKNLYNSSSGGAFTAIAQYVIEHKGYVVGCIYDEMEVVHSIATTMEEVAAMRGSKYSQSKLGNMFSQVKDLLKGGNWVLFTGTPCQIDGLNNYLQKRYDSLITMDVVCHAVPSPKIFKEYINYASRCFGEKIVFLNMRDKNSCGWSHSNSYRFTFANGKNSLIPSSMLTWDSIYFSKMIDRPSCHECMYTNYHRASDITVADFWDDNNYRPDIYSKTGTSLMIVNTEFGNTVFNDIKDKFAYWEISQEESWQPCLEYPTIMNSCRADFWKFFNDYGFEKTINYFFYQKPSFKRRLKSAIKQVFGALGIEIKRK